MREALRPYYSVFRPLYRPLLRSWAVQRLGVRTFDAYLWRARKDAKFSTFHPRYPFALDRGPEAMRLQAPDPNNPFGHEPELAHLLDLLLPDDGVFLDIGSNYGYFAIYVATRPHFRGRVHAFEPIARTFAGLQELVTVLGCANLVTCHQLAASDRSGNATMETEGLDPGLASIREGGSVRGETVATIRLDSLQLQRVDFLKVDVEGHEAQALIGAPELIGRNRPFVFLESWSFPDAAEKVYEPLRFLIERDYRLYLPAWLQPNGQFFVGIGPNFERRTFALLPFTLRDRLTFPSNPINIFACPVEREAKLGSRSSA